MRRRPKRSPRAAPVSRRTANVSVYAFTVHSRLSMLACRSFRITGSAVVTTRLSSVAMKTAVAVIANVQIVRVLAVIDSSFGLCFDGLGSGLRRESGFPASRGADNRHLACEWSLTSSPKKGCLDVLAAALDQALGPTFVRLHQIHRGDHVEQHPLGEEVRDALGR